MAIYRRALLICILAALVAAPAFAGNDKVGIVLLHGKQDRQPFVVAALGEKLKEAGYRVAMPEMPWSRGRIYDASYEDAMAEIDKAADALRSAGAERIIVAGQSLGANAAIGYSARREGLAGLIVLAPGHFPELKNFREQSASSVARAKEMIAAGRGDEKANFSDTNTGKSFFSTATAKVYLSYFDPEGPALVPVNCSAIRSPLPILWVVGSRDNLTRPEAYAFSKAPPNPKSRYVVVKADHLQVPDAATGEILTWLEGIDR